MISALAQPALAPIPFDRRRALWLGLCIADGLSKHFAQLSLGLRRLTREGFLPLGHELYVGMPEAELNPTKDCLRIIHVRFGTPPCLP
jgi:hypothetical protein